MRLTQVQIDISASLIAHIDSGERNVFLETVNTENQVEVGFFQDTDTTGIFYGCTIYGGLRIQISFDTDTDAFNEDLITCLQSALKESNMKSCAIWIRNENKKVIDCLKERFRIPPKGKHYYASIEFIMRRDVFSRTVDQSVLEIRPYEEAQIDRYLSMLDGSMTYIDPPANFMGNKDHYLKQLADRNENNAFEAFWIQQELIGLYWRKHAEIEVIAVASNHQREGYGTIMLTRAIEMVFANTQADYAYLYAVDWNTKGQSFYKKYGMEQNGHSYGLQMTDYTE